ncbi:MAG: hypothetical protein DRP87_19210, partial [Spirochaetes bacterium]
IFLSAFLFIFIFTTCKEAVTPVPELKEEVSEETITETEDLEPVKAPEYTEAIITFFSGDVFVKEGDDWIHVQIGDLLRKDDVLKVDTGGYCEIQFGQTGVVRVQEDTQLAIDQILLNPGEANVRVEMTTGAVLAKVKKLAGGESFKVKTPTAVCGVRGTEFGVKSTRGEKTEIAVKEGEVAVLPANVDVDELKEKAKGKGEEVKRIIEKIEERAIVVSANQETEIDENTLKETEEAAKVIEQEVEEIAKAVEPEEVKGRLIALEHVVEKSIEEMIKKVELPKAVSEENAKELEEIDKIKMLEIPVTRTETMAAAAPVIKLVKVSLEVDPLNAEIKLNGESVGKGRYSGIYPVGEELRFEISREGFDSHTLEITTSEQTEKLYRVKLAKLEAVKEEISIKSSPEDAEILLNGELKGTGTYTEKFEPGEKLSFLIRREGYHEKRLDIDVKVGSGKTYNIALERKTEEIGVTVTPNDARVLLNGRQVGVGNFKDEFPVGERLHFTVRKDGWEEQTLDITVTEGSGKIYEVTLKEILEGVQITATPSDATIFLNNEEVGRGSFSGNFKPGERFSFRITRDGYETKTLDIAVSAEVKTYNVVLEKILNRITINTVPRDASILLGGRQIGNGSYTGSYERGTELSFVIQRDGYKSRTFNITVPEDRVKTYEVALTRLQQVTLSTEPRDASIYLNGSFVGRGSYSERYEPGRELLFTVRRDGYKESTLNVAVSDRPSEAFSVVLKPLPLEAKISVSRNRIVGSVATLGDKIYAADSNGLLTAANLSWDKLWSLSTRNSPNENSSPVIIKDKVYLSGSRELVIAEALSGSLLAKVSLEGESAHLFGRRVVGYNGQLLLPANDSIIIIDPATGEETRRIPIPGGSRMTPTVWQNRILIVDQQGTFLIINPDRGTVEAKISTQAVQPVALTITVYENTAYFSGRKGTVVAIDLGNRRVKWERKLREEGTSVFTDVECGSEGAFVFARDTIFGLSLRDGSDLFNPLTDATSAPLYSGSKVYYGGEGKLIVRDASRGSLLETVEVGDTISTKPARINKKIVAGTTSGNILLLNPSIE